MVEQLIIIKTTYPETLPEEHKKSSSDKSEELKYFTTVSCSVLLIFPRIAAEQELAPLLK
jgi:hypothetical protein